jgi:Tetratricopeptide repeat
MRLEPVRSQILWTDDGAMPARAASEQRRQWCGRCAGLEAPPGLPRFHAWPTGPPRALVSLVAAGSPAARENAGAPLSLMVACEVAGGPRLPVRGSHLKAATAPQDHRAPRRMPRGSGYSASLDQGDLEAARPLLERAMMISERVQGPEHPDTATSLSNFARLLPDQGNLAAARSVTTSRGGCAS